MINVYWFDLYFKPQLQQTEDELMFRQQLASHSDVIYESGYRKPIATSTLANKEEIVMTIFLHQTVYSCLAELDQLRNGLNVLGVVDEMSKSPRLLLDFFTSVNYTKPTAGWLHTYLLD